jgi:hypothetical protein
MNAYEIRRIDDFDALRLENLNMTWRPIRRTLGITAFGINAYTGDTGEQVVEEHTEGSLRHEEVYVVINGRVRFTLGDDEQEVDARTVVYIRDPDTRRGGVALEDGTTVLAVGGRPGHAYEPSAWEWWFAAAPLRDRGDLEGALATVREGLDAKPGHPVILYQIACYEALLGRRTDALLHLREAVAGDARAVAWARDDEDFESLRGDAEFLAITGDANLPGPDA